MNILGKVKGRERFRRRWHSERKKEKSLRLGITCIIKGYLRDS